MKWQSIETAHFRVSFYSGEERAAVRVADLAEAVHRRLVPVLGHAPRERTEIVLTDSAEGANGSATALPFNTVRMFLTAPEDLSPLGDVDDWYLTLFTHEYTHILHLDNVHGLPSLVNAILGKTLAPNQAQPRFITEGIAVLLESTKTSGGRLRASQWNMYMRTDVVEDNFAPLDQLTGNPRRFPQGNLWYLYGSYFFEFVEHTYGEAALGKLAKDYGGQLIPWGINRSLKRATGKTFEEMYPAFRASVERRFRAEVDAIRARGLREGERITFDGQTARNPRFPRGRSDRVVYFRDDAHELGGLYALPLFGKGAQATGEASPAQLPKATLLTRTNGSSTPAFTPDGSMVFDSIDVSNGFYRFFDLHRLPARTTSPFGIDEARTRLTAGYRATQPDVSPDGRWVVFVSNHRGTSYVQLARLDDDGLRDVRPLVPSHPEEQAFAPRFSPDGTKVAYSVWQAGGYRDVRIVDVATGKVHALWKDRAVDGGPSFSPDGRTLYFHSDRTGVMNVYAYDLADGALHQVTNVRTGAYQPQVSPDGSTLVYVGYTKDGFDLFRMPVDRTSWLAALPYDDPHPEPPPTPAPAGGKVHDYNPLLSLAPRAFRLDTGPGNFGQYFRVAASGSDVAGMHALSASLTVEVDRPEPQFSLGYSYGRLPVDVGVSVSRSLVPRAGLASGPPDSVENSGTFVQENLTAATSISYSAPAAFDGQSIGASFSATRVGRLAEPSPTDFDPANRPAPRSSSLLPSLNVSWSYGSAVGTLWSIGAEYGWNASFTASLTHPMFGGTDSAIAASGAAAFYRRMPRWFSWMRHHAVAIRTSGGMSAGSSPTLGPYFIGGFFDPPLFDTFRNLLVQGGVVLRGYAPGSNVGRHFTLTNAEYRFPIVNVDRGPSTLPVFFNRVTAAAFVDVGATMNTFESIPWKVGAGGELWFDTFLAYVAGVQFRVGYARGFQEGGAHQVYFVAAAPY